MAVLVSMVMVMPVAMVVPITVVVIIRVGVVTMVGLMVVVMRRGIVMVDADDVRVRMAVHEGSVVVLVGVRRFIVHGMQTAKRTRHAKWVTPFLARRSAKVGS